MADTSISGLPAASAANATDELPSNQAGTTRKITAAQILAYVQGLIVIAQSQVTGLVSALAAKADASAFTSHTANTSNPHSTTASQVGAYSTSAADALLAAKAPLASPTFTGTPAAPTAAAATNTTQVATTAFTAAAVGVETTRATTAEATKATAVPEGRAVAGSTIQLIIPGVELSAVSSRGLTVNRIYYMPWFVSTPISIDQLVVEVTVASAAATVTRVALYNADTAWQPTSRVIDAGTVDSTTTGVKTISVSLALPVGRYLAAVISDGVPTLRVARGGTRYVGINAAIGASALIQQLTATGSGNALPDPGTVWNTASGGTNPMDQMVFARVSTP
jgi:hypothetical protein